MIWVLLQSESPWQQTTILLRTTYYLHHSCYLNVTPSSKVDVGDVAVLQGSSTAAEQLNSSNQKRNKIEDVTGKFRYNHFGYLCMVDCF